ncbi:cytochrome P450 [Spongisporangium articulatum]|uniref:Cytochrome P450 n=1 Tax=Spongisporangium articulatum TaxID=3362603 RepID=A0ABW8ANE7_9ACTN
MTALDLQRTARRHESRLLFAARPAAWLLFRLGPRLGSVRRIPRLGWVVSDPAVARGVLTDSTHFSVFEEGGAGHLWSQVLGPDAEAIFNDAGHRDIRRRTRDLFTEENSRGIVERSFGPTLTRLGQRLDAGEQVDVVDATRVLVGRMAADIVGVDLTRDPRFAPASDGDPDDGFRAIFELVRRLTTLALGTLGSTEVPADAVATAQGYLAELTGGIDAAFGVAAPDTVIGRCRDVGLTVGETRCLAAMMLVAATETGATSMTRALALLHDTGLQHRLRAAPDDETLLAVAVAETLRVTSPAPVIGRHVTGDVTVEGRTLRADDRVLLLIHPANNAAGGFDLDRDPVPENRQVWFGGGRHICMGAPLARAEIGVFLEAMARLRSPWRVVERRYGRGVLTPAYAKLVVELES